MTGNYNGGLDKVMEAIVDNQRAYYKARKETARLRKLAARLRKLAARLRKEKVGEHEENRPRIRPCAGWDKRGYWGV